ncbi:ScbA/BarX family gamma-butyrolactone biosynthesis protein [Streptomyces sp. NBC_00178]|uniref:ScbA/BarX family gamma-butyrolactone biosynthesis protein n=1 Tax=Streptomyces sp. NBC_00178 TaxID=2975672 RepID=UPI002E27C4B2|nr:ScbA/BarX family gamma-butyrolactone biosynthesis protein [Streptomyces sp. NBC_00178]
MAGGRHGVSKEYVHLVREDAVFLTGWQRLKDGEFSLTARWPEPPDGLPYDPRVLTQTIRQSGLVVAHASYEVPLACQTLLHYFDFTVVPGFRAAPGNSSPLSVGITVTDPRKRGRSVSSLGMDVRLLQGDRVVARADSEFGWISPAAYRRLRGHHLTDGWNEWTVPAPLDPRTVGRTFRSDVVLAPGDGSHRWQLRNDADNVLLYDHPVDHVPGLVLMEAASQAANAALHPLTFEPTTVTSAFEQYAEFDRPCWVDAEVVPSATPGEISVLVTATQSGQSVFRGRLSGPCG